MQSFDEYLTEDLEWREKELDFLKTQALRHPTESREQRRLLRALWTLLYAHYEGYCLSAIEEFLSRLERKKVARKFAVERLLLFSLEHELVGIRGDQSATACLRFFRDDMPHYLDQPLSFPRSKKTNRMELRGDSNLYPDRLLDTCSLLGIAGDEITNHRTELFILVTRRNEIAHGQLFEPKDVSEYRKFENAVIAVMYGLACELLDYNRIAGYVDPTQRESLVRKCAYHMWLSRGCPDGQDVDCWCQAESELSV